MNSKKKALGRGLSAILESPETDITTKDISGSFVAGAIANVPIASIESNPFQPREAFDEQALLELSLSIKEQGIIQPITVRKLGYDKYQLISGERRLKASKMAGLKEIPTYIRVANDQQMLEMALVENIQRESLNALEIALSYNRLIEECNLTMDDLSVRVGKNRSTVTNFIRLLKLPAEIQVDVRDGLLSMGHARAIINIDDNDTQLTIARNVVKKGLSVREVEEIVRNLNKQPSTHKNADNKPLPPHIEALRNHLATRLSLNVDLKRNTKGRGTLVIAFSSDSELEKIISAIGE